MRPLISHKSGPLKGRVRVPGDKSISHRALMLGASAVGQTRIFGLLEAEDVLRTYAALDAMGVDIDVEVLSTGERIWRVHGVGVGGLAEPATVLDLGNSGTAARLIAGLVAAQPLTAVITGDASLNARPMSRVIEPLTRMGARFEARSGGRLPLAILGTDQTIPIVHEMPVASAQVKSAVLLAGLNTFGTTTVIERDASRDHTEHLLRHFGAEVTVENLSDGRTAVSVAGQPELTARSVRVPGDVSSAAFLIVAALTRPGSTLTLESVGVNPLRSGLLETLEEMGARLTFEDRRIEAGEPVADLIVEHSRLRGVDVPPERAPRMIDEYPILAVAAACADGPTRMRGIGELRVKESDRLAAMARGLAACSVAVEAGADSLTVLGRGYAPSGGAVVTTGLDHRIAMSFLVLGMVTEAAVAIDDAGPIDTSFPGFVDLLNRCGARIAERGAARP